MSCNMPGWWLRFSVGDIYVTLSDAPTLFSVNSAKTVATLAKYIVTEPGQTVVVSGKAAEFLRRLDLGTIVYVMKCINGSLVFRDTLGEGEWVEVSVPCEEAAPLNLPLPQKWYFIDIQDVVRLAKKAKYAMYNVDATLDGKTLTVKPPKVVKVLEEPAGETWDISVDARNLLEAWKAFEAVKTVPRELGCAEGKILCLRGSVYGAELIAWISCVI